MNATPPDMLSTTGQSILTLENEYRRLAQRISDGPGQLLANAIFELRSAKHIMRSDLQTAEQGLDALLIELRQGLEDLQQLVFELQPSLLDEVGLEPVLRRYVEAFQQSTDVHIDLQIAPFPERLPPTLEITLFRVIQECLRNVQKHAQAQHVSVIIQNGSHSITLAVEDDGQGFTDNGNSSSVPRTGWLNMHNRAALVGGTLHVFDRAGGGMLVTLDIPYVFADDQTA